MRGNVSVVGVFNRVLRQMSEQYFTSLQFLAQHLRQVIGRPQVAQGFEGSDCLLPLKAGVARVMPHCSAVATGLGSGVGDSGGRGYLMSVAAASWRRAARAKSRSAVRRGMPADRATERCRASSVLSALAIEAISSRARKK